MDYVITNLTLQLIEKADDDKVHCVTFQFVDLKPRFDKVKKYIADFIKNDDCYLVDYDYSYRPINENDLITDLEVTKH